MCGFKVNGCVAPVDYWYEKNCITITNYELLEFQHFIIPNQIINLSNFIKHVEPKHACKIAAEKAVYSFAGGVFTSSNLLIIILKAILARPDYIQVTKITARGTTYGFLKKFSHEIGHDGHTGRCVKCVKLCVLSPKNNNSIVLISMYPIMSISKSKLQYDSWKPTTHSALTELFYNSTKPS